MAGDDLPKTSARKSSIAWSVWLNDADRSALEVLAALWGMSKQSALRLAIHEAANRLVKEAEAAEHRTDIGHAPGFPETHAADGR